LKNQIVSSLRQMVNPNNEGRSVTSVGTGLPGSVVRGGPNQMIKVGQLRAANSNWLFTILSTDYYPLSHLQTQVSKLLISVFEAGALQQPYIYVYRIARRSAGSAELKFRSASLQGNGGS